MRVALLRNKQRRVDSGHENRAGHRFYVKVFQTRQVRMNIVGFGKWRKHNESTEPSNAYETADPSRVGLLPRAERRYEMIEAARASRRQRRAATKLRGT